MTSIRLRLLKRLVVPVVLVNLAGVSLTWLLAWAPAQARLASVRSLLLLEAVFSLVLAGLVWLSVSNGLSPLARMRANLKGREGGDLAPIAEGEVPWELEPVAGAFNELLGKVEADARARHDFLADMAHQLRTPLAGIQLQLEWLGARHGADAETARSVQLMRQANERMIRQVNQLLALARATPAGLAQARPAPLDLAALVGESVQVHVEAAADKGVDLGFELAHAPVLGDAFQLRDLVDNLVDNAVRYTPPGGAVTVRCAGEAAETVFAVEDSGPGIPAASRQAVFNRFVRLDEKSAGSGLGLAIVRDIALAHRARVALSDMPGGGLRAEVRFPAPA